MNTFLQMAQGWRCAAERMRNKCPNGTAEEKSVAHYSALAVEECAEQLEDKVKELIVDGGGVEGRTPLPQPLSPSNAERVAPNAGASEGGPS